MDKLTPYVLFALGGVAALQAWIIKRSIEHGEKLAKLETSLTFYFDTEAERAAMVLKKALNPTPESMQHLLQKHVDGTITPEERETLKDWLREVVKNPQTETSKYSAAMDMLAAMGGRKRLSMKQSA